MKNTNKTISGDWPDDVKDKIKNEDIFDDLGLEELNGADKAGEEKKEENGKVEETVKIQKTKLVLIKKLLENIRENNDKLVAMISVYISGDDEKRIGIGQISDENMPACEAGDGRVVEGVFDGENMIGPDGKQYSVPANYASKSKLVEGDILKLTITGNGVFLYKQIGPAERSRVVGKLEKDSAGAFSAVNEAGKRWRVLTASITYFHGEEGDEAVILTPKGGDSKWAAVENVIKKREGGEELGESTDSDMLNL